MSKKKECLVDEKKLILVVGSKRVFVSPKTVEKTVAVDDLKMVTAVRKVI